VAGSVTRKLFYDEPELRSFEANVTARLEAGGRPAVVLDRTAFYATSGGQPCDGGTLEGVRVVDVFEAGGGGIVHVLEAPLEAERVRGEVDWARRVDHSQQHHGQHILSAAFARTCGAQTASFRLGPETCSIDLDRPALGERELRAAEALANEAIRDNRPVSVTMASRDEAARMGVRKLPDGVEGPLRIVSIPDLDAQPCSGTHPRSTGFVQAVCVLDSERTKGALRVTFVCGGRVVRELAAASKRLREASARLSAPPAELAEAIARRLEEERSLRRALAERDEALAEREGREIFERGVPAGGRRLCLFEAPAGRDLKGLKRLAQAVTAGGSAVVVLAAAAEKGCLFVAGASADHEVDLRETLRRVFERSPGRGGGEPKFVQGSLPEAAAAEALRLFRESLGS
jgi:alanyl-tRNA synthetase